MHGGLGRARRLKLGDELAHPRHVGVDRNAVIAAQADREIDIGNNAHRIIKEPCRRRVIS